MKIKGDGHCLYRALALLVEKNTEKYPSIRQKLLEYMNEHADRYLNNSKLHVDLNLEIPAARALLLKPESARAPDEKDELRNQFRQWLKRNVQVASSPVQSEAYGGPIHCQAFADMTDITGSYNTFCECALY